MLEIVIQGRGGQGAQTAGNLLAAAYFAAGNEVQCFASYGGARRGTPVSSFLRVDDRPVRLRCDIERADAILCFDASLLAPPLLASADAHTLIVVNSSLVPADFAAVSGSWNKSMAANALTMCGLHACPSTDALCPGLGTVSGTLTPTPPQRKNDTRASMLLV
mgnify:CR=1 FL=1